MFTLANKNTLIIEDFTEFARSVRTMLYSLGNQSVEIVSNAEDAIEACRVKKFDVLLSDYNLGERKDGQQLLEELMAFDLLSASCIFIMLTAENTSAMVMGAIEHQPDNYIAKPFTAALLKSRIAKAVEKKEALSSISGCIHKKKWSDAINQCRLIASEKPKYRMSCLRSEFKCLKMLNKLDDALTLSLKIISDREVPWALQAVGEIYFLQTKYDKAISVFKNMTKKYPMNLEAYDWLAKTQQALGQSIDAQETIHTAIKKAPKVVKRQKSLGSIAEQNDDFSAMSNAFRQAIYQGKHSVFSSPEEYVKLTYGLKKQISQNTKDSANNSNQDKLIMEAEQTFKQLENKFKGDTGTIIRSNVAHAAFSKSINNKDDMDKYSDKAKCMFEEFEGILSPQVSLEISKSLKEIEEDEFAEAIIKEAILQNLDDKEFIKQISNFTQDKELIQKCKQAAQQNEKGIYYFRKNEFKEAIEHFEKAYCISPKNINIALNYSQALLKLSQNSKNKIDILNLANKKLLKLNRLEVSDSRYARYSELNRLTQLMLSKLA